jgi:hypothetical protein
LCVAAPSGAQAPSKKSTPNAPKDLDFSWEVAHHRDGLEEGYGQLPEDRDADDYGDSDDEDEGIDDLDYWWDATIPACWDEIGDSFKRIQKEGLGPGTSYGTRKNAMEAMLGIARVIIDSDSQAATMLVQDEHIYEIVFTKELEEAAKRLSAEDVKGLKKDQYGTKLKKLAEDWKSEDQRGERYTKDLIAKFA